MGSMGNCVASAWKAVLAGGLAVGCILGCQGRAAHNGAGEGVSAKQYPMKARVVSVDQAKGTVVLAHEAIPGFMGAMTMTYPLKDPNVATELHAGDRILAQLDMDDTGGERGFSIDDVTVTAQANPNVLPPVQYHLPKVGEAVPNFRVLDQDGKWLHLDQFRGKVLVMTFIYTRCPLANYCPLMSHNFAQMDAALAKDPKAYAATDLLSVSFDPAYDTPKVLRSYGGAYTGRYTREDFAHWQFAAPSVAELPKVEQWFDLGVTPGANGTLSHSLATLIVGKDGKVAAYNPTNDWTAAELTEKVKAAVGA